jgi:hypothetical protein
MSDNLERNCKEMVVAKSTVNYDLKMEATHSSAALVKTYQIRRCHNDEDRDL